VIANVSLDLVDHEHVTVHALQLSYRNDRQKKWASGSFLAKTDETYIFRLVPRRLLRDYPIILSKRTEHLKSVQKNWVDLYSFQSPSRTFIFGSIPTGTGAKFSRKNESRWRTLKTVQINSVFLCWFQIYRSFRSNDRIIS